MMFLKLAKCIQNRYAQQTLFHRLYIFGNRPPLGISKDRYKHYLNGWLSLSN